MAGVKGRSGGARPNTGGARPNSGPKPKPPALVDDAALETKDPRAFLEAVMAHSSVDIKLRTDVAKYLDGGGKAKRGKKELQQEAAEAVAKSRDLSPTQSPSRPRLTVVGNQ